MRLIVKAFCMDGGQEFDGLDCEACFSNYFDDEQFPTVFGGYMSFEYDPKENKLYTITEYNTTKKLSPEKEKELIEYTQGQWSDGIGEGFEQQPFSGEIDWDNPESGDEDVIYNPSPWYHGQIATIIYKD